MEHPPPADVIALVEHVFERLDAGTGAWRLEFFATDGHVNRDVSILHDILKVAVREELIRDEAAALEQRYGLTVSTEPSTDYTAADRHELSRSGV